MLPTIDGNIAILEGARISDSALIMPNLPHTFPLVLQKDNCVKRISLLLYFMTLCIICFSTGKLHATQYITSDNQQITELNLLKKSVLFYGSELLSTKKSGIDKILSSEPDYKKSHVILNGSDRQTRPIAVTFQRAFEQSIIKMLHQGKIKRATIIIHTDRPTTPLCNLPGNVIMESLPDDLRNDPKRIKTIKGRTESVRMLARAKQVRLIVAYTADGMKKRSSTEQQIFKNELANRRNTGLKNAQLSCKSIPEKLTGATYVLELASGDKLFFSLNGTQAQDSDKIMNWEYWFDSLQNPKSKQRLDHVLEFLNKCGLDISI